MLERRRGNEKIRLGDQLSLCPQRSSDDGKASCHRPIDPQDIATTQKLPVYLLVSCPITAIVDALEHFSVGNDADRKTSREKGESMSLTAGSRPFEIVGHPVTVEQGGHSSTGGRLLLLRS